MWFISPLGLRTGAIQGQLSQVLFDIWSRLESSQVCLFFNLLWEIWKARCGQLYGGKNKPPQLVLATAMAMSESAHNCQGRAARIVGCQEEGDQTLTMEPENQCWVDGSYTVQGEGGQHMAFLRKGNSNNMACSIAVCYCFLGVSNGGIGYAHGYTSIKCPENFELCILL